MNKTDLRFAFHMDTGSMPMWSYDYWMEKVLNHGHPTSEYGRWLEEHTGNARWLQRTYQFENKTAPIYSSVTRSKREYYRYDVQDIYDAPYCFWLEQIILNKHPEVIKNILHI